MMKGLNIESNVGMKICPHLMMKACATRRHGWFRSNLSLLFNNRLAPSEDGIWAGNWRITWMEFKLA